MSSSGDLRVGNSFRLNSALQLQHICMHFLFRPFEDAAFKLGIEFFSSFEVAAVFRPVGFVASPQLPGRGACLRIINRASRAEPILLKPDLSDFRLKPSSPAPPIGASPTSFG
jgi:hypothetical protein